MGLSVEEEKSFWEKILRGSALRVERSVGLKQKAVGIVAFRIVPELQGSSIVGEMWRATLSTKLGTMRNRKIQLLIC